MPFSLNFLHDLIARAMVMFAAAAGVWGVYRYARRQTISPDYWGVIVIGNLTALAQAGIGLVLLLQGLGVTLPRAPVHILYGVVLALWIPLIQFLNHYANRDRSDRTEMLICGLVSLFEAGIALRAITTARS